MLSLPYSTLRRSAFMVGLCVFAACGVRATASKGVSGEWGKSRSSSYPQVLRRVIAMPGDSGLQARARRLGLNVVNVMWEDTARWGGSALGPNISDLTLQVRQPVPGGIRTHLLPVIRHPNFNDKTGDLKAEKLWVRVGNHRAGGRLEAVPLTRVLANLRDYLSDPNSIKGDDNFLAARDSHFLLSAQHVFVPIAKGSTAEFNPVIFNYQSAPRSPAVLTLLVTREGTSAAIIENKAGDQTMQGWGQQLFFNNAGQRTVFTAERRSDVKQRLEGNSQARPGDKGALDQGADMMMVVQVPLKHRNKGYWGGLPDAELGAAEAPAISGSVEKKAERRRTSDVERAVIGHGDDLGPYAEMAGLSLKRDSSLPIRVTVQFYRATSNGVVSQKDLLAVNSLIQKVYNDADYVGSLVVPRGSRHRPTDWIENQNRGEGLDPPGWNPWAPIGVGYVQ